MRVHQFLNIGEQFVVAIVILALSVFGVDVVAQNVISLVTTGSLPR